MGESEFLLLVKHISLFVFFLHEINLFLKIFFLETFSLILKLA